MCPSRRPTRAAPASRVREADPPVYRPRHPERTPIYRLFERHFERYRYAYEERFEPHDGPLRPVVGPTVEAYLDCGRLLGGFARLRCPKCRGEHLLAFSCQTRNFCPSCQAKRAALFAEKLADEILAPVPHRHFVFTIPRVLRRLFLRDRRLLGLLSRCAFRAVRILYEADVDRKDARPGGVASIQTFGAALQWHPHVHALLTDGLLTRQGAFLPVATVDTAAVEELFRRLVITALVKAKRLSQDFAKKLLSWRHSGFSVYARQLVLSDEPDRLGRLARYLTRPPLAQHRLRAGPDGSLRLAIPPDARTGATSLSLDPLDAIHALTLQIPDPKQHLVRYYGAYANRARRLYRFADSPADAEDVAAAAPPRPGDEDSPFSTERRKSWARLLRKILEVEPLLCPRCRVELSVVSVITDPNVVDRILEHVGAGRGHDPFEPRAPPAP